MHRYALIENHKSLMNVEWVCLQLLSLVRWPAMKRDNTWLRNSHQTGKPASFFMFACSCLVKKINCSGWIIVSRTLEASNSSNCRVTCISNDRKMATKKCVFSSKCLMSSLAAMTQIHAISGEEHVFLPTVEITCVRTMIQLSCHVSNFCLRFWSDSGTNLLTQNAQLNRAALPVPNVALPCAVCEGVWTPYPGSITLHRHNVRLPCFSWNYQNGPCSITAHN